MDMATRKICVEQYNKAQSGVKEVVDPSNLYGGSKSEPFVTVFSEKTIDVRITNDLFVDDNSTINRESTLTQKRFEAEQLRDEIAAGYNKLFEATVVSTLFAYSLEELDKFTKLLSTELSKTLVGIKSAWAMQEECFQSNLPLMENKMNKVHTFDRRSMGTVFPFTTSEVGHPSGIPLGFNKQTGVPILFDNFHNTLTNYNMVIFAKSGARKICYNENFNIKIFSSYGN